MTHRSDIRIALLRAVNVGGTGKLPMAGLRALASDLGFGAARTMLQTGNLVFESDAEPPALEARLQAALADRFRLQTRVFVRAAADWNAAIAANPFADAAREDPSHLLLLPLTAPVSGEALEGLAAAIRGRERVAAEGLHAYAVYPDGIGTSKLTMAILERFLGPTTGRNWNTALKIAAAAASP
ncbi:MAG TPA: DUF1697 domain-containing protein [Caulobacteraceae bacterium]|nr:DUF1697 domain-containing protein [Caulobacteraceae bacterium]